MNQSLRMILIAFILAFNSFFLLILGIIFDIAFFLSFSSGL